MVCALATKIAETSPAPSSSLACGRGQNAWLNDNYPGASSLGIGRGKSPSDLCPGTKDLEEFSLSVRLGGHGYLPHRKPQVRLGRAPYKAFSFQHRSGIGAYCQEPLSHVSFLLRLDRMNMDERVSQLVAASDTSCRFVSQAPIPPLQYNTRHWIFH
jgi:hypothetical protein